MARERVGYALWKSSEGVYQVSGWFAKAANDQAVGGDVFRRKCHPAHRSVLLILVSDSFTNTENYTIPRTDYQRKNTVKREYWYIDYHDVTNVVKYRLAAIRQRIESSTKKVREREINPLRLLTQITKLLNFSLSA